MATGDITAVETGDCTDLYCIDTGMYDTPQYGSVYLVDDDQPALVDTGIGTNHRAILRAIERVGVDREDLAVIAPTHVHLDHAGGAGFLADACPNAEVYVHEFGAPHLADPTRLITGTRRAVGAQWQFYREPRPVPEDRLVELTDGDSIDLGTHELRAHHAPGHAPHQVVFEDPANEAVFTADAAGVYVPSLDVVRETTPPSNFDLEQALSDVETIRDIDPTTLLYGHFGAAPTADRLDAYAERLEAWVGAVEAAREDLGEDSAVVEHFVDERAPEVRDAWGGFKADAETKLNVRGVLGYLDSV
jgi:glyoxylase-like metal-dependent hydrolase (beta-lactamase superfamily II)